MPTKMIVSKIRNATTVVLVAIMASDTKEIVPDTKIVIMKILKKYFQQKMTIYGWKILKMSF